MAIANNDGNNSGLGISIESYIIRKRYSTELNMKYTDFDFNQDCKVNDTDTYNTSVLASILHTCPVPV